ncbi:radical SAM protein [Patescibacteria group bacterium]|nr:radical SAM protein [Patescibacteria group bacterium]MBU1472698.1 radical SAM protein [Patescibacteria group bacterium]MBU2459965.1 radical SAM protein [Patescibacteria group bacterium]MBU2544377.1 radical SAM protein [Patescibacteria group bacterium]
MDAKEIQAKSILTKTSLKNVDFDYSVNPYIGCRFGCVYCYASFMGRFVGKKIRDWGEYVYAKVNAPELLAKEITKLPHRGKGKAICFSIVTDPYQGIEAKYKLTRKCLEVLIDYGYLGDVHILTKSDLLLRNIDIFRSLPNIQLGLTITSSEDKISRYFEKYAPPVSSRLKALRTLNKQGFHTYAFLGPLLPNVLGDAQALEGLFEAVAQTGNKTVFVEYLNAGRYIVERLKTELAGVDETIIQLFQQSKNKEKRIEWDQRVKSLVKKYGLHLGYGETLYHPEMN